MTDAERPIIEDLGDEDAMRLVAQQIRDVIGEWCPLHPTARRRWQESLFAEGYSSCFVEFVGAQIDAVEAGFRMETYPAGDGRTLMRLRRDAQ